MRFNTRDVLQPKDARTLDKSISGTVIQKSNAEATELLERYLKSSERFQRGVYGEDTKTNRR